MPEPFNFQSRYPSIAQLPRRFCALTRCPTSIFLAERLFHVISREPVLHLKNASDLHSVSVSTIPCQACILRPSCHSTLILNKGDLVFEPDMDYFSNSSQHFFATVLLVPSLAEVFSMSLILIMSSTSIRWAKPPFNPQ